MYSRELAQRRHLDLGCGTVPRNPYKRPELFGIDVRLLEDFPGTQFRQADLSLQSIPFSNNYFGSVSAFDYFEHVPRILQSSDGSGTFFPFVRLMSEVWRVLIPGGRLYALTPAFPNAVAFQDPTHVNIVTSKTHEYFCGSSPMGAIYGFKGKFNVIRAEFVVHKDSRISGDFSIRQKIRRIKYSLQGKLTHFLWELEAIKD